MVICASIAVPHRGSNWRIRHKLEKFKLMTIPFVLSKDVPQQYSTPFDIVVAGA